MVSNSVTTIISVAAVFVSALAAGAAAVAAIFSAGSARTAVAYSRSVGKAAVSLRGVNVQVLRPAPDRVDVRPFANFENVGKEPLQVLKIKTAYYEFTHQRFTVLTDDHGLVNTIHRGVVFNHPWSFSLVGIDPGLSDNEVVNNLSNWVGKLALVVVVEYEGELSGATSTKYYVGYKGGSKAYHLATKEYLEMEPYLSDTFRRGV